MRAWFAIGALALSWAPFAEAGKTYEAGEKELEVKGEIKADAPKIKVDFIGKTFLMPAQPFTILLKPGFRYRFTLDTDSPKLDPFLVLKNGEGKTLAQDDDGGGQLNSMLTYSPPDEEAKKYEVFAASLDGKPGPFVLTVTPQARFVLVPKVHEVGKEPLQLKDLLSAEKNEVHVRVNLKAGKTYRIDMSSKKLDSYLELLDPLGRPVAQDDDGGGKRDARITKAIAADGTYRIVASSTNLAQIGDFSLEVREE